MDYDFSDPDRQDADVISFAAGHKTMASTPSGRSGTKWSHRATDLRRERSLAIRLEDLLDSGGTL